MIDDLPSIGTQTPERLSDVVDSAVELIVENICLQPLSIKQLHEGPLRNYSIRTIQYAIKYLQANDKIFGRATERRIRYDSIEYTIKIPKKYYANTAKEVKGFALKKMILLYIQQHYIVSFWELLLHCRVTYFRLIKHLHHLKRERCIQPIFPIDRQVVRKLGASHVLWTLA